MIDFVKVVLVGPSKQDLIENPLLNFKGLYEVSTAETDTKLIAEYRNMKFIIYNESFIMMQGSLHKYKNEGKHNYDSFTFSELKNVLKDLQIKFKIDIDNSIIQNVEVGVNINPPIKSIIILDNLLLHKQMKFKDVSLIRGTYKQVVHQRYLVKAYDKKIQYKKTYNLKEEILRFELKFIKSIEFNKVGLNTLLDLMDNKVLKDLSNLLQKEWGNCLMFDSTIEEKNLSKRVREVKMNQWRNWSFWVNLSKQNRFKQMKKYNEICQLHSLKMKEQIMRLIEKKNEYLIQN